MRAYTCQCGRCEFFGSDTPRACQGCDECGTNYYKEPLKPHNMRPQFDRNTGKADGGRCSTCYARDKNWVHPGATN